MKYACDFCGVLYSEKDAALKCEMRCLEKVCEVKGHDWGYYWEYDDYKDKDLLYRRCRRCTGNGGSVEVSWNEGEVRELMGKVFDVAKKEAGK